MKRLAATLLIIALYQPAWAEWATRTPFTIPLADNTQATGLFLAQDTLLVAKPGQPPTLELFAVTPIDQPRPDPNPKPEPGPQPQPDPQPRPTPKGPLTLLWVEETAQRSPGQAAAITDKTAREAIQNAGWALRILDVDVKDENGNTPPDLAPYIQAARTRGLPTLFAIDPAGAEIYAGKAPADASAFRELLSRLGLNLSQPIPNQLSPEQPPKNEAPKAQDQPKNATETNCPTG